MFDTISFCIGEKTIEINGASFSLGELTTQVLNIPKDEYQSTSFHTSKSSTAKTTLPLSMIFCTANSRIR